uniref:Uncharacterized protein LOC105040291 isoform X3 n=1 Tax=Elaeis guineensis var. tenera TaxID=51953 RepID=A0A8N4F0Q6_ELAGV|nr:uncharacterized protein LOC105040291 isoform X3 [Elaeis guineensis]
MESLQRKASEWSGVAASDAFAIDETNLFETLGGIQPFVDLCTNFYTRSYFRSFLPPFASFLSLGFVLGLDLGLDLGFSMTRRSGSARSSQTRRRRTRFGTCTSSWCRGWGVLLSTPRGKPTATRIFPYRGQVVSDIVIILSSWMIRLPNVSEEFSAAQRIWDTYF